MIREKLKPCPFCGASVSIGVTTGEGYVACSRCGMEVDWQEPPEKTAKLWNTRPVTPEVGELCERLDARAAKSRRVASEFFDGARPVDADPLDELTAEAAAALRALSAERDALLRRVEELEKGDSK